MTMAPHYTQDQDQGHPQQHNDNHNRHHHHQGTILVTGGAGFIGSHTVVQLLSLGKRIVIIDNLSNASEEAMIRAQALADNSQGSLIFHKVDLLDTRAMERVFETYSFWACIHFAGLKAVGESSQIPLRYYQTNITGTLNLVQLLQRHNCRNLIFSSSATVYGLPACEATPIAEDAPLGAMNPYGRTKLYIEDILRDIAASESNKWNIILLRYFNPVGAHESGRIGEDPYGTPNNLMPFVAQVAIGRRPVINVFGDDYETKDGTGVRDYIHVVDLARGHIAALNKIETYSPTTLTATAETTLGCVPYNLGSGVGYSVMDMIHTMSKTVGRSLPYKIIGRRAGDIGTVIADPSLSFKELGWRAEKTLQDMCDDLWRWQTQNPEGYGTDPASAPTFAFSCPSLSSSVSSLSSMASSPTTPLPGTESRALPTSFDFLPKNQPILTSLPPKPISPTVTAQTDN
ncbi:hypothetical protein BGZ83_008062 [Gryganskiella cystojenkinii]|nr:hypothetical protein BGZ83_008062 [Gryganskiella cystojenkinii]